MERKKVQAVSEKSFPLRQSRLKAEVKAEKQDRREGAEKDK